MVNDLSHTQQKQIIEDFRSDREAFARVYDFYYEQIFHYLLKRCMSAEVAYDLTADTFIKAFKAFHKFEWQGYSIKVWLYRIAINNLNSQRKKPQSILLKPESEYQVGLITDTKAELKDLDKALFGDEELGQLSDAIATLNPKYQNVISLYYFTGLSQKEIAETIGRSPSAVKSMMHRAITHLRQTMLPSNA